MRALAISCACSGSLTRTDPNLHSFNIVLVKLFHITLSVGTSIKTKPFRSFSPVQVVHSRSKSFAVGGAAVAAVVTPPPLVQTVYFTALEHSLHGHAHCLFSTILFTSFILGSFITRSSSIPSNVLCKYVHNTFSNVCMHTHTQRKHR